MAQRSEPTNQKSSPKAGLSGVIESFLGDYFAAHEGILPAKGLYDRVIQEVERPLIEATLKAVMGNQKRAAEILGINRNTLRKKVMLLEIDLNQRSGPREQDKQP
jgi:two-component system nitrogen regulation response regulator GlnG